MTGMRIRGVAVALLGVVLVLPGQLAGADHVQPFVTFDPAVGEFPEGVAADKTGNVYVSLTLRDQIRKIDPSGTQTVLADFPVAGTGPAGLAVDPTGVLYTAAPALNLESGQTDPAVRGVYRVHRDGTTERLPGSGGMLMPNDVTLDKLGNVYATDTIGGAVWRVPKGRSAELWVQDPLLEGSGAFGFGFPIGANGIAFRHNRIIVANTERGLLVEIPVRPDGSAGKPTTLADASALIGADGIALDVHGGIYVVSATQNTVVRVRGDGAIDTLATADHGLNQPSTVAFGTGRSDHQTLYVANFSLFSPEPTPGILTVPAGQPGQPLP